MNEHEKDTPQLPPDLVNDLRAAYLGSGGQDIAPSVDREVVATFQRQHRSPYRFRWAALSAAAAVAIVIGGAAWWQFDHRAAVAYAPTGDIRDAFYLARQLAAGQSIASTGWDKNGDGVVNQADVHALAMAAVTLPPGERQ